MYNEDFRLSSFANDSSSKNKISQFLQSEFVRDLFPEHNSKSSNPNLYFGSMNSNTNYRHYYSQATLPKHNPSSRQSTLTENQSNPYEKLLSSSQPDLSEASKAGDLRQK